MNSSSLAPGRGSRAGASTTATESLLPAPWLALVAEKVATMHFGVIQIVIHDSKVVQIEQTERTRFDFPQGKNGR